MDAKAMNGAIHGIDKVLIAPPTLEEAARKRDDLNTFRRLLKTFTLRRFDARASRDNDGDGIIDSVFVEEPLITGLWWRNQAELLTAFAPTDAAFNEFFRANGYASYSEVPRNVLEILIKYHFVKEQKKLADLGTSVKTAGDEMLTVTAGDITTPDIQLNNGVLHVTNKVLLPPSLGTLTGLIYLNADKDLSSFAAAVEKAAMGKDLSDASKQYTVFAPTNAAFTAAGINVQNTGADVLAKVVRYHVLNSKVMAANLSGEYETNLAADKKIKIAGTTITGVKNSANITQTDKVATNGVLHKIDKVLLPE
jgi:transforming growth factor-beta-induced protein